MERGRRIDKKTGNAAAGFTLIEILIVISIIAILAATIIPNLVGFDAEARITATKSNLETIRTTINLFRAKEGGYPESLGDLLSRSYYDAGIKKPYVSKMPAEMVSDKRGNKEYADQGSGDPLAGAGGWIYITDTAEVKVNITEPLGKKWGEYADEVPSEW